jgi:hypothetical protein
MRRLAPGDKIMQILNDYNRDVFNGDLGTVVWNSCKTFALEPRNDAACSFPGNRGPSSFGACRSR